MTTPPTSPILQLGSCFSTASVNVWMAKDFAYQHFVMDSINRHRHGDWGDMCSEDSHANDEAVEEGGRVVSKYTGFGRDIYIITEFDRSYTTIMFTEEY